MVGAGEQQCVSSDHAVVDDFDPLCAGLFRLPDGCGITIVQIVGVSLFIIGKRRYRDV